MLGLFIYLGMLDSEESKNDDLKNDRKNSKSAGGSEKSKKGPKISLFKNCCKEKNGVLKSPIEIDNDIFAQLDDEIANNHSESSSNYEINGLFCSMIFNLWDPQFILWV